MNEENQENVGSINLENLNKILKKLKSKLSCGEDKITNIMLKNVNEKFKVVLLNLCQMTVKTMNIPDIWKRVIVKMIPTKANDKNDPKNYLPISITSCIARLCEKFILIEIHDHLKKNKIIIKQQLGFRALRQTKENIFAICQRNPEAFNLKKNIV